LAEGEHAARATPGTVHLVGAGPGDPGLLTQRALALIATADVILHDRLIPPQALDGARADAELLYVGKEGGGASVPQEQTEELMVQRALEGKSVLRLKGGDPFVFGRGGEEALVLRAARIPFEVVPGVTSGIAAPACAGIPVTHRGLSSAVALITGHEDPAKEETDIDWHALAAFPGTLVFYMGVGRLPRIAQALIAAGRNPDEPAAVVESGTLPGQRSVTATLATIAEAAAREGFRPPSVTVVGAVAELAQEIAWREPTPLAGRSVVVTRAREQSSGLARGLSELGARVIEAPAIRVRTLPGPALDPSPYDLVCVTSANGAELLFERLAAGGRDARALAAARVAAIGAGTAQALARHGVTADILPERSVAEGLVEALREVPVARALIARGSAGRDVLPDALRQAGAQVDVLELYETIAEPIAPRTLALAAQADYVTFTSSSTVRFYLQASQAADGSAAPFSPATRLVSIGPVTSETLREHGLAPHVEAAAHDVQGVIEAILGDVRVRGGL